MSKTASRIITFGSFTLVVSTLIAYIFWGDLLGYFALLFGLISLSFLIYGIYKKVHEATYIRTSPLDESDNPYKSSSFGSDSHDGFEIIRRGDGSTENKANEPNVPQPAPEFEENHEVVQSIIPPKKTTVKPPDFLERYIQIARPERFGPARDEFEKHIRTQLSVIKDLFGAYTCAFFVTDPESKQFSLLTSVSNSSQINNIKKMDLEDDILSKIIITGEPNLLSNITPVGEGDTIRYYTAIQEIRSFVGVPVFHERSVFGVIVVDSREQDVFGIETIFQLAHFSNGLSAALELFLRKSGPEGYKIKYDSLMRVLEPMTKFASFDEFLSFSEKSIFTNVPWDAYIFVGYDDDAHEYFTHRVINKVALKYIGEGYSVELRGTLVGKAILENTLVIIDDTAEKQVLRFSKSEELGFEGSFIAIPIVYKDTVYGVLCFESLMKKNFKKDDIQYLKGIASLTSFVMNTFESITSLKNNITVDIQTKFLKTEEFLRRLSIELLKSRDLGKPGALSMVQIDDLSEQESFFGNEILDKAIEVVSSTIDKEISYNDIVGKVDEKTFAIYSFNTEPTSRFVWAEKLRKSVARSVLPIGEQNVNITVSIGIYIPYAQDAVQTDARFVYENTLMIVRRAAEKRNSVLY